MNQECPKCKNWAEGKKKETTFQNVASSAMSQGVGYLLGGNPLVGMGVDFVAGNQLKQLSASMEETLTGICEFEFKCPKCGYQWSSVVDLDHRYSEAEIQEKKREAIALNNRSIEKKKKKIKVNLIVGILFLVYGIIFYNYPVALGLSICIFIMNIILCIRCNTKIGRLQEENAEIERMPSMQFRKKYLT